MDLSQINVVLKNRKWMRSGKAWRLFFDLPADNPLIPSVLSGMIDRQFGFVIEGESKIGIDPAIIVDVPATAKSFQLVIETCFEKQNGIAPYITDMMRKQCLLSIVPANMEPPPHPAPKPEKRGNIHPDRLKGLHLLFQKPDVQQYVLEQWNASVPEEIQLSQIDDKMCKEVFKQLAGVDSCKELSEEYVANWRDGLNRWLRGGGA